MFIETARRYYAFDLVPSFWRELARKAEEGRILNIDRVRAEIGRRDDEVWEWVKDIPAQWFERTERPDVLEGYRRIIAWLQGDNFTEKARAGLAAGGNSDARVAACAMAGGYVVVTPGRQGRGNRNKIPVPDICRRFGIPYMDAFQMLRDLNVRLA